MRGDNVNHCRQGLFIEFLTHRCNLANNIGVGGSLSHVKESIKRGKIA